ncbi:M23 family peptidase, partial [Methylobacterium trifolii]
MRRPPSNPRIGPARAPRLLAAGLLLTTLWALGASYVVVFHDEVLAAFVARQGAVQVAYEARLSEMRAALDQGRTDRSQTQDDLAMRLSSAVERQTELERRQSAIAGLSGVAIDATPSEPSVTGSLPDPFVGIGLRRSDADAAPSRTGRRSARE